MERQRQTHSKEIESKDEEVEEIRRSCGKKVRAAHFHSCILKSFFKIKACPFSANNYFRQIKEAKKNSSTILTKKLKLICAGSYAYSSSGDLK